MLDSCGFRLNYAWQHASWGLCLGEQVLVRPTQDRDVSQITYCDCMNPCRGFIGSTTCTNLSYDPTKLNIGLARRRKPSNNRNCSVYFCHGKRSQWDRLGMSRDIYFQFSLLFRRCNCSWSRICCFVAKYIYPYVQYSLALLHISSWLGKCSSCI